MLSDQEVREYCAKLNLPDIGTDKLKAIRLSEPVRAVRSGPGHRTGAFVSHKMGFTLQYESATVELPFILKNDYDDDVLEQYDQPDKFKINPLSKDGKKLGYFIKPDSFLLRRSSVGYEEYKTAEEMEKLVRERPNTYYYDEVEKRYRFPAAEQRAAQYGFYYRIRVSSELNWNYLQNISYLADYLNYQYKVNDAIGVAIRSVVSGNQGISIANILSLDGIVADDINAMIARREIYVDLDSCLVSDSGYAYCFSDETVARACSASSKLTDGDTASLHSFELKPNASFLWDGVLWTIVNDGNSKVTIRSDNADYLPVERERFIDLIKRGEIVGLPASVDERLREGQRIVASAGSKALEKALERQEILSQYENGCHELPVTERTIIDWKRKMEIAEIQYGNGFVGLIDNHCLSGNRDRTRFGDIDSFTDKFISDHYENVRNIKKHAAYVLYEKACEAKGLCPFSKPTFYKKIEERPRYVSELKRNGPRAAYALEELGEDFKSADVNMFKHANRPWEISHIDHYEVPAELVFSKNRNRKMGKVWLSAMIDDFDRKALSVCISFDPPSYRTNMEVVRECVRRHGRVPDKIVSDNGKDFESYYYRALLAYLGATREHRPPNEPKHGALIERLFGTGQEQFFDNVMGNTEIMNRYRQVTKVVEPKRLACWYFGKLLFFVQEYFYDVHETVVHSKLRMTPREKHEEGILTTGKRDFRIFPYDDNFLIMSMPGPVRSRGKRYTAKVCIGGVKMNNLWYRCKEFKKLWGERVEVRYDPWHIGIAYAHVKDSMGKWKWAKCTSEYYSVFCNRTEKELAIAAEEWRREQKLAGKRATAINGKILADFLTRAHAEESKLMEQRRRDEESSGLRLVSSPMLFCKLNAPVFARYFSSQELIQSAKQA